jgi:hypothetical protein
MDNATYLAAISLVVNAIIALYTLWLKQRVTDQQNALADLQTKVVQPSQNDVLELYNAASKTMQAVNKLLRGHGRAVSKQADQITATVDTILNPPAAATPPKKLIGGREGGVGGLITGKPPV